MSEEILIQKFKNGDIRAADDLLALNEGLVKSIFLRHYKSNASAEDDFLQEGRLGVLEACRRYDHEKQKQFGYYKSIWIRKKMGLLYKKENAFRVKKKLCEENRSLRSTSPIQGMMHDIHFILDYSNVSGILPKKDHDRLVNACFQFKTIKDDGIYRQIENCR